MSLMNLWLPPSWTKTMTWLSMLALTLTHKPLRLLICRVIKFKLLSNPRNGLRRNITIHHLLMCLKSSTNHLRHRIWVARATCRVLLRWWLKPTQGCCHKIWWWGLLMETNNKWIFRISHPSKWWWICKAEVSLLPPLSRLVYPSTTKANNLIWMILVRTNCYLVASNNMESSTHDEAVNSAQYMIEVNEVLTN